MAYVLIDQINLAVTVYRCAGESWGSEFFHRKDQVLGLPDIDCSLPLAAIYERTELLA